MTREIFNKKELELLNDIILKSEEMVANHYKMSTSSWKKLKYEIKTLKDLKDHERVKGPFAQVMKYDAKPWGSLFASSLYTLYRICVQDNEIMDRVERYDLPFKPFLFYIIIHELIHVVRFSKYLGNFEAEKEDMEDEEELVHGLTEKMMDGNGIIGREKVFDFFENHWPYR